MTKRQIEILDRLSRAVKKELGNFKSKKRKARAKRGLALLNKITMQARKQFYYPAAKTPVRIRVQNIIEKSADIDQTELMSRVRGSIAQYRTNPNFASYFSTVMGRLRNDPPPWLGFRKLDTKWHYWNEVKFPEIGDQ